MEGVEPAISPDDFSMYVLFRSRRNYNYESKAELWEHLTSDLKSRSSITLLKFAENYQVFYLPTKYRNLKACQYTDRLSTLIFIISYGCPAPPAAPYICPVA
jgi:hypothetical protein